MAAASVPVGEKLEFFFCLAKQWNAIALNHGNSIPKGRLENAAVQLLAPSYSIAFAIETLLQERHLFGAELLLRPLIERVAVLNYLAAEGEPALDLWERGWDKNSPSLSKLVEYVPNLQDSTSEPESQISMGEFRRKTLKRLHKIVHADPFGSLRCLAPTDDGYRMVSGPMMNNPVRYDEVATDTIIFISALLKVTERVFPGANWPDKWV